MRDTHEHLHELLKKFDHAMLVSRAADGKMHARPMAVAHVSPGNDAFFVTNLESAKVAEIESHPDVLVTFQGGSAYATVAGRARVVRDRLLVQRYWSNASTAWFPRGADNPDLCVIAVHAEDAEYWDRAGGRAVKYALEAAKAYVTGTKPETGPDQHAKVKL